MDSEFLSVAGGAATGMLGGGGVVWWLAQAAISRWMARFEALEGEVKTLRDNHIATLEKRIGAMESGCPARHDKLAETLRDLDRLAEDQRNMTGWLKKIDAKLDRISDQTASLGASQAADSAAKGKWLENLDAACQRHFTDREIHRG